MELLIVNADAVTDKHWLAVACVVLQSVRVTEGQLVQLCLCRCQLLVDASHLRFQRDGQNLVCVQMSFVVKKQLKIICII